MIRLMLADDDGEYASAFTRFISQSQYSAMYEVRTIRSADELTAFVNSGDQADLLLAGCSWAREISWEGAFQAVLALTANLKESELNEEGLQYKYQPVPSILLELHKRFEQMTARHLRGTLSRSVKTEVVAFYSAAGGTGKSTVALHVAHEMAREGKRVIYMNLETTAGFPLDSKESGGLEVERLLFDMRMGKSVSIPSYTRGSSDAYPFEMLRPLPLRELLEMDASLAADLMNSVAGSGRYDLIAADLDSGLSPRNEGVLQASTRVFWIASPDAYVWNKTMSLCASIQGMNAYEHVLAKSSLLVNKWLEGGQVRHSELPVAGKLPYIPAWKVRDEGQSLFRSALFAESVSDLCKEWFRREGAEWNKSSGLAGNA